MRVVLKILICWRAKMMIFGNICQIVRKRCQMIKQMRKKAHLEEKYLVLGGFCPKTWKKSNFFTRFAALKFLSCWIWPKKAYLEEYSPMTTVDPNYRENPAQSCHWATVPHPLQGLQEAQEDCRGPQQASQHHQQHLRNQEQGQCMSKWSCIYLFVHKTS